MDADPVPHGVNIPRRSTLRGEVSEEAWESLNSAVSRPFPRPAGGKVAVKAINHLGDEVMRVFDV